MQEPNHEDEVFWGKSPMKIPDIIARRLTNELPDSKVIPTVDIKLLLCELEHYQIAMRSDTQKLERLLNACRLAVTTSNLKPVEDILEQEDAWERPLKFL